MVSYFALGNIRNRAEVDKRLGWTSANGAGGGSGGPPSRGAPRRAGSSYPSVYGRRRPVTTVRRSFKKRTGKSRKLRKRRKRNLRPVDHSKRGVSLIYEVSGVTGGTDDDTEVCYIGHANMPARNMLLMGLRAIMKQVFMRLGVSIRGMDDALGFGGNITFFYYPTPVSTAGASIPIAFLASSTPNNLVDSFLTPLLTAMDNTPALRPYSIVIAPTSGVPRTFYTDSVTLDFSALSRLKFQNRTPNEGGTDAVDTNDINHLVGQKYWGSGTGTYVKSSNVGSPHSPLIAKIGAGSILMSRTDNFAAPNAWLRHPPETTKFFTRVKGHSSIKKFAPGGTLYSSLYTSRKISFAGLIDSYLKEVNTNSYALSTLGKFAIFGFQKYLDDDASVKVKLAYEVELQIGASCSMKSNTHTQPVYVETVE